MNNQHLLLVFSGPSGVGKGTVLKQLQQTGNFTTSVSCTTRAPRQGEVDGKDYFFITNEAFDKKVDEGDFLEYDRHFGNAYGTPKSFVVEQLQHKNVIVEIDVHGALNIKAAYPAAKLFMILPPSREELENRLRGRQSESEEEIKKRLERYDYELGFSNRYDYVIVNESVEDTVNKILKTIEYKE